MTSYAGRFLIAMPALEDKFFARSVIYLAQHDERGAMGFVINKPISHISIEDLYRQLKLPVTDPKVYERVAVVRGGPVQSERGFVIHPAGSKWRTTIESNPDLISVTMSLDVLEAIAQGEEEPIHVLVALGYASWEPGQLEKEIQENSWLLIDVSREVLFEMPFEYRWLGAAKRQGVMLDQMVLTEGHA